MNDAKTLRDLLVQFGTWQAEEDTKLRALEDLLTTTHPDRKVLVFTQFADTVRYLGRELAARGVSQMEAVTGDTDNPTRLAWRFSPKSNEKEDRITSDNELRVIISTDVLSEGQNLQDCAIVVNYDLPWAIIRLIQRAGRVDRIGQQADNILCYSFLPADGIERLIRLRTRVRTRLDQNAEVVGTDEAFFEDEDERAVRDLYHEQAGILDGRKKPTSIFPLMPTRSGKTRQRTIRLSRRKSKICHPSSILHAPTQKRRNIPKVLWSICVQHRDTML